MLLFNVLCLPLSLTGDYVRREQTGVPGETPPTNTVRISVTHTSKNVLPLTGMEPPASNSADNSLHQNAPEQLVELLAFGSLGLSKVPSF